MSIIRHTQSLIQKCYTKNHTQQIINNYKLNLMSNILLTTNLKYTNLRVWPNYKYEYQSKLFKNKKP